MPVLRVAVIDRHEIITAGATALLSQYPEDVEVVSAVSPQVDLVLCGLDDEVVHDNTLHDIRRSSPAMVVAFGWREETPAAKVARACGAHAFARKGLTGRELLEHVLHLHRTLGPDLDTIPPPTSTCGRALRQGDLTPREVDVLSLIASGLTNREIADRLFVSVNSVKTYIKSAYRKIEVGRRSQAVAWAHTHGLDADADPPAAQPENTAIPGPRAYPQGA